MPDATWQVEYRGLGNSLEKWGIENLEITFTSQFSDQVTFALPKVPFDADRVFAYGETIRVLKDGKQWFVGRIIKPRFFAGAQREHQEYTAVGPWWVLEQSVFEQAWGNWINGNNQKQTNYTSHLVLNGTADGVSLVNTGDQIRSALQWLLDGVDPDPFQIGEVTLNILPPVDEARDLAVAEVIRKQMRWHPDAVGWFDHSATPPKFNCKKYAELTPITLRIPPSKDATVSEVTLESREDLIRPAVIINYEVRATINDEEKLSVLRDAWPLNATGRDLGSGVTTLDLQGAKITTLSAPLQSRDIPNDLKAATSLDWWKTQIPELGVPEAIGVEILDADRLWIDDDGIGRQFSQNSGGDGLPTALPYELMWGQVTEWMPGIAQKERITIKVRFSRYDSDPSTNQNAKRRASVEKVFTKDITSTNLPSGVYTGPRTIEQRADPIPIGLAKALYDAMQILHYSGSFKLTEQEVSGSVRPGMVVNLEGGRAEWGQMKALVQQVTESVATGETTITVGPPERLGISDLIELLKVNRTRTRNSPPGAQADGLLSDGGGGALGKHSPNSDRAPGSSIYSYLTIESNGNTAKFSPAEGFATFEGGGIVVKIDMAAGSITMTDSAHPNRLLALELARCFGGNADRVVRIQETFVCVTENGQKVQKRQLALVSDVY
jgi:hypothetical protein